MITMKTMYVAELGSAHFRSMTIDRADVPNRAGLVTSSVQAQVNGTSNDRSEGFGGLPNGEIEPSVTGRRVSNNDGSFPERSAIVAGFVARHDVRRRFTHAAQKNPAEIPQSALPKSMNQVVEVLLFVYSPAP